MKPTTEFGAIIIYACITAVGLYRYSYRSHCRVIMHLFQP